MESKLVFATNLNGTDNSGIVNIETMKVFCICEKENADTILKAMEYKNSCLQDAIKKIEEVRGFKVNEKKAVNFCIEILKNQING